MSGVSGRAWGGLELPLESTYLFASQSEFLDDRVLRDVLLPGVADCPAKVEARAFDELAGVFLRLLVCLACGYDIAHRVRHSLMVSRLAYHHDGMYATWHIGLCHIRQWHTMDTSHFEDRGSLS
jgi:hypothetical protein